jgi:hypothetical protein
MRKLFSSHDCGVLLHHLIFDSFAKGSELRLALKDGKIVKRRMSTVSLAISKGVVKRDAV